MTIRTVLLSLQTLLAVPEADDPQDAVVARQYTENIELFRQTARYWTYIFALPSNSIETKTRFKMTPTIAKFPTARSDLPINRFMEFNMKVRKLVEIMQIDELAALHELSSHSWDLDEATQSLISWNYMSVTWIDLEDYKILLLLLWRSEFFLGSFGSI